MKRSMHPAELLRRSAERVAEGATPFACIAMAEVLQADPPWASPIFSEVRAKLFEVFSDPDNEAIDGPIWRLSDDEEHPCEERIIGLLLLADAWEDF